MEITEIMKARAICPIRLSAGSKHPECTRVACAWWANEGACSIRLLAEKKGGKDHDGETAEILR